MALSLFEFKSTLQGLVRPNRFLVWIYPPSIYDHGINVQDLIFYAQDAKLPEQDRGVTEIKFHGMQLPLPGDYTHNDLIISFNNSYDWSIRDFFEGWSEVIQNINYDNSRTDAVDLISDGYIAIQQYGNTENDVLATYYYYNIWPKTVGEITLSMNENDTIEIFPVTFAYSHAGQ